MPQGIPDFTIASGSPHAGLTMLQAGNIETWRQLAPLPPEAERVFDNIVREVNRDQLRFVSRLIDNGLVFPLPNWLETLQLSTLKESAHGRAHQGMEPLVDWTEHRPDLTPVNTPIPATWDAFTLGTRTMLAAAARGYQLDTRGARAATLRVNETIEWTSVRGPNFNVQGAVLYGLLTAPNANTVTYAGSEAWDAAGKTGLEILTDLHSMYTALDGDKVPTDRLELFIPKNYKQAMGTPYTDGTTTQPRTVGEMLLAQDGLNAITVLPFLPNDRTALVRMSQDTVELINGQQPVPVNWPTGHPFEVRVAILACQVPRFHDDKDGNSGIVLGNV